MGLAFRVGQRVMPNDIILELNGKGSARIRAKDGTDNWVKLKNIRAWSPIEAERHTMRDAMEMWIKENHTEDYLVTEFVIHYRPTADENSAHSCQVTHVATGISSRYGSCSVGFVLTAIEDVINKMEATK